MKYAIMTAIFMFGMVSGSGSRSRSINLGRVSSDDYRQRTYSPSHRGAEPSAQSRANQSRNISINNTLSNEDQLTLKKIGNQNNKIVYEETEYTTVSIDVMKTRGTTKHAVFTVEISATNGQYQVQAPKANEALVKQIIHKTEIQQNAINYKFT